MTKDFVRMILCSIPWPQANVNFTRVCEIAGAMELLLPGFRRDAAHAFIVFFLALMPVNIHAEGAGVG